MQAPQVPLKLKPDGQCTALAAPRMQIQFACDCAINTDSTGGVTAGSLAAAQELATPRTSLGDEGDGSGDEGGGSGDDDEGDDESWGLCGFSVEAETGKVVFQVRRVLLLLANCRLAIVG